MTILRKQRFLRALFDMLFWTLIIAFPYRKLAFRSIPSLTYRQSDILFWCLILSSLVLNILTIPKYARNTFPRILLVGAPFGLHFLLSLSDLHRIFTTVILSATGLVLALYTGLIVYTRLREGHQHRPKAYRKRFWHSFLHRSRCIVCTGLSLLFFLFFIGSLLGFPLLDPHTIATDPKVNDQRIADNMETILLLQDEEWAALDARQRLNVLQTVANIEATYLGLPHELNVVANSLPSTIAGHYTDTTHTITVSIDCLTERPAQELVRVIAHEAYHAYEHRLVDLYGSVSAQERNLLLFSRIETYQYNFAHYITNEEDRDGYAAQAIEIDSNNYSVSAVTDYYDAIEDYLRAKLPAA